MQIDWRTGWRADTARITKALQTERQSGRAVECGGSSAPQRRARTPTVFPRRKVGVAGISDWLSPSSEGGKMISQELEALGIHVERGVFGARMAVELVNEGPVTVVLE